MMDLVCWGDRTYQFDCSSTALIVVDMQRDFLDDGGYIAWKNATANNLTAIVPNVQKVLKISRQAGLFIVHTREGYATDFSDVNPAKKAMGYVGKPGPNGSFLIRGTLGHDFMDGFLPEASETVIDKAGFSAFYNTGLDEILHKKGITHLVFTGITTQCCVQSTLRDAVERGYFCLTLEDCCAAEDPALHEASLKIIQGENHLFGWISSAALFVKVLR